MKANLKIILITLGLLALLSCSSAKSGHHADVLWRIVSQQCIPNQKSHHNPSPCAEVFLDKGTEQGHVVLKDINGPLQYLLLPTLQVSGIESPWILAKDAPNYFYLAWQARAHMIKKYGRPISDQDISLAINSKRGRSQNQLHIHVSCIRVEIKALIEQKKDLITGHWSLFPGGILGHAYYVRRISRKELESENAFRLLAQDLPGAQNRMSEFGLALVATLNNNGPGDFLLLADRADLPARDWASVEEIQDHQCPQLH